MQENGGTTFYSFIDSPMRSHSRAFLSASPIIIIATIIHHNHIVLCKLQSAIFGISQRQGPHLSPFNSLNLTWCLPHGRQSVNSWSINEKIEEPVASSNLSLIIILWGRDTKYSYPDFTDGRNKIQSRYVVCPSCLTYCIIDFVLKIVWT